ncbi:U1 snRNP protein [Polyrhizophydium stewartii]|uniref:U1 snRNP protein n=1 Tax=Polyrhizophydium stewartii TaxID=2732419 RepID=A0ABR4N4N7_9FUNG
MLAAALDVAQAAAGPFAAVFALARAVADVAARVRANRAAAAALARRCLLLADAVAAQLPDGHSPAVRAGLDDLEDALADAQRLLARTAAKNTLQQTLTAAATADRIRAVAARLDAIQQTLQIAVALQGDALSKAILQDTADLPVLLQQLTATVDAKFDVQNERLETLLAINTQQQLLLDAIPAQLQSFKAQLSVLLSNTKNSIIASSGRGLSSPKEWTVEADSVDILWDRKVGSGSFGSIYHAVWDHRLVAVKLMDGAHGRTAIEAIEKESAVWYPLNHPNVVRLWGVCLNTDKPFLVMPLMQADLAHFLMRNPDTPLSVRVGFLLGIARGMQYLHGRPHPIVHGDLKANNVLLAESGDVCITDFGLAFIKTSSTANTERRTGAVRWIAPEKLSRTYSLATPSDVFAFAMTAFQILTGSVPFADQPSDDIVALWLLRGERPDRPPGSAIPDALWGIIQDCWKQDPAERPVFSEIVARIATLETARPSISTATAGPTSRLRTATLVLGSIPSPPSVTTVVAGVQQLALGARGAAASDADLLVSVFPEWCRRNGITRESATSYSATISGFDPDTLRDREFPVLDWGAGRLVGLRISGQNLKREIPREIGLFSNLQCLDLSSNRIKGTVPEEIGNLKHLRMLDLSDNLIKELHASIGKLKNLSALILWGNMLSELPESMKDLEDLEWMSINNNQLTEVPEWIGELTQLRELYLSSNQIKELPESIGMLTQLEKLGLSDNYITVLPSSMSRLTHLVSLSLSGNPVASQGTPMGFS